MRKAFTLIELIATIVILGVVTSVVSILIMNVIRNAKDSANKRSIDNYGRIVETSMVEYQSQYLKYPDSIDQLEIEYVGSVVECETRRINPDKTIYLSECKVNGKKVLDKSTEDGYYHYGILVLTNEEYVDKLGNNIDLALKDYYEENNKYPVNYRLLNLPKLDKDVNCVSHINSNGTVYLTKCSIDGSYILNENEEDGYYHYGEKNIYDYVDSDGNGYTEVVYIESTGAQYIDTGVKLNHNSIVNTRIKVTSPGKYNIFGSRTSPTENNFAILMNNQNNAFMSDFYSYEDNRLIININDDENEIIISKEMLKIGSNTKNVTSYSNFETPSSAYMFDISGNPPFDSNTSKAKMRLYYLKIYNNDNLVRDYIPVTDKDGVGCLFDRLEKKCYYNDGSGAFITKAYQYYYDLNGNKYKVLNYLESNGTQYIDTGVKLNQNSVLNAKIKVTSSGRYNIFGSRTSPTENNFAILMNDQYNEFLADFYSYENNRLKTNINYNENEIIISKEMLKIGSNTKNVTSYSNFETPSSAYIFDISGNPPFDSNTSKAKMRLYYLKIYNNDNLIRDYIPLIDSSNRPCLFDKVENKCYYNQGSGEFLYG